MGDYKQVIIVRKDLNMRKGKMIAQGAHASLEAYNKASKEQRDNWENSGSTKIVVGCDTEEQLIALSADAIRFALPQALIRDAGKTEFKEPTLTALAIGPDVDTIINEITANLKLL